jgi:hypothetical protein
MGRRARMLSFDPHATRHGGLDETCANARDRDGSDRDKLVDRLRELGRVVPVIKGEGRWKWRKDRGNADGSAARSSQRPARY